MDDSCLSVPLVFCFFFGRTKFFRYSRSSRGIFSGCRGGCSCTFGIRRITNNCNFGGRLGRLGYILRFVSSCSIIGSAATTRQRRLLIRSSCSLATRTEPLYRWYLSERRGETVQVILGIAANSITQDYTFLLVLSKTCTTTTIRTHGNFCAVMTERAIVIFTDIPPLCGSISLPATGSTKLRIV